MCVLSACTLSKCLKLLPLRRIVIEANAISFLLAYDGENDARQFIIRSRFPALSFFCDGCNIKPSGQNGP